MTLENDTHVVSRKIWLTTAIFLALFVVFGAYVYTEKQIDHANNLRQTSYQLADQLRQSSDDLTRMARTYVGTGDLRYRQYYQDIRDIRDGRKPWPGGYMYAYWDMVLANAPLPHSENGQAIALLDLMHQAEFTNEELGKLAEAKQNSDSLVALEFNAMELVSSAGPEAETSRVKANRMLLDDNYHQAKARIMKPINEFYMLMDKRTIDAVHAAEKTALLFRVLFIATALLAIFMLWRSYVALRATLGGSVDEVSAHIARIGRGDFSSVIPVDGDMKNSVLGWLSATQINLSHIYVERKHAEESLRKSETRLAAILDNVLDGIITIDELGTVESFNKSAEKIFGYVANGVIGNNVKMLMPEPYHSQHDGYLHNYVSTGNKKIIGTGREVVGQRKNGSAFPMELAVSEMQLGDRRMFTGVVRDITERKKSEDDFANISRLSQAVIGGADHMIITTDTQGIILSFNRAAEENLGYRAEELVGKLTPAVFHDPDEVVCRAQKLTASGFPVEPGFEVFVARSRAQSRGDAHEWTYVRKDGSRFPVALTVTALRDGRGEINAFLGIATDITERKQAEDELRKLSRAIEQSPVSVMITNARGNIEYVNAKFSEVTGYTLQEVMGKNPRIIQSGLTPEEVYRSMWQALRNGQQWRGKLQNRKKNGNLFWEEMYISAILDGRGKTINYVAVKEDITERMKVERMKSEFVSTVSHELRTPLTSIRGALALITGGVVGELPAAAKPLAEIAHKNSERLILLVNDILDMEKIEAGKMEFDMQPVELMPLLKQALDGNRAYAEQYKVSYELKGEPTSGLSGAIVKVDRNRLMQVLANLLSNAAKFSPAGGKVSVVVERLGQRIRVSVKDNGSGIPDEFKDRMFQKFSQADSSDTRKKGGTGLGLSITKAIVEQMGGSIGFDSQPDVQTTFYVDFPELTEGMFSETMQHDDGSTGY